jgi:CBS domain-containing protein
MALVETYPALEGVHVADAMHAGLISCRPDATLRRAARMLATYRVHALLVRRPDGGPAPGWGVVTDTDVIRAAESGELDSQKVRSVVATPPWTVTPREPLPGVAARMVDAGVSHVVVVDGDPPRPVGVLSTLDVARALAGFPERHPPRA